MARRILVVEDEAPIREMVCFVLEQNGYQPLEAEDYDSAVTRLSEPFPDLVLLDWMLPGGSGIQFIKHMKREALTRDIPVMMLTARGEEEDVRGLEVGADDYITKPFSPKELVARIKAVMRRISPMAVEEVIEMQGLSLDPSSHRVMANDQALDMGPTEFKLLHFFMTHPERVYSREQLLNHVWGTNVYVEDRTVDVHIRRLRKALETSGHDKMVQTVRGTGYRFSTRYRSRRAGEYAVLERLSWKRLALSWLFCLPALLLGLIFGYLPWFLLASALAALVWNFYNQLKLSHWLWIDRSMTPPPGRWSWEPLFYGLYQMQQRNRRRRRELALLIKRFRSGAESLPDAVVMTTVEGNIFWCNGLAQHLLGFRWPEDNGQHILNLLRYPEFSHYLQQQEFSRPLTLQLNNAHYVEFRVMPYSEGQLLMVARDVTQMRQLEGARRNFFANVSHELRTPLTVLQGYLEMMGDEEQDGSLRSKALGTMQEQTRRMDGLVKQLLTLSRIEAAPNVDMNERVDIPLMLRVLQREAQSLSGGNHEISFR